MGFNPKQYEVLPDESTTFKVEQLEEGALSRRGAVRLRETLRRDLVRLGETLRRDLAGVRRTEAGESAERRPALVAKVRPETKGCLISSSSSVESV